MKHNNKTFREQDFSQQLLQEAIFENCRFYLCNFSRADLRDAQFINCKFIEAGENVGCQFNCADLRDASFKQCRLAMANFQGANGFGAEFRECDLQGASFVKTSFVNHISHQSYFCSVYITGCNLSYTNFERQCIEKCDLFENRWTGANLQNASFKGSDLSRGEFSSDSWQQFDMQYCDLSYCELYGLDPRRINLNGVKICDWQQEQLLDPLGVVILPS
ncbi:Qnr family pentapeptide repeat protein [Psychromonas aquimarina]|uniref:Qnr family pentapeptide repeat protein n=1 Tax=Psychromonas aquimarina TaxID=444919 RepID=UPI00041F0E0D|nr:Qnr family pentapeptide repeat protein [Psychromonas aquimarina]